MIVTKKIEIKIGNINFNHFKKLGYDNITKGDIIIVNVDDLMVGSRIRVDASCDICNIIKNIPYSKYLNCIKNGGYYSCHKCSGIKNKMTCIAKYGINNVSQLSDFKEKVSKKWKLKTKDELLKIEDKRKKTNMCSIGVEYSGQLETNKEKIKKTNIERYGVENPFQSDIIKEKIKKTNIEKYGVEYPMQCLEIFDRSQISSYKRYTHEIYKIKYQGSYELDFINFCINYNISLENAPTIDYVMSNKNRRYHPDFYIPKYNLICEIKSSYTFSDDIEKNLLKQKACLSSGYNFLFIIDKDYTDLQNLYINN